MANNRTLDALLSAWLAEEPDETKARMTSTVCRHVAAAFGVDGPDDVPLSLAREMPDRLRRYLHGRQKPVKAQSIANYVYYLNELLRWGEARGMVPEDPTTADLEAAWPDYDHVPQRKDRVRHGMVSAYLRFRRWAIRERVGPAELTPAHFTRWWEGELNDGHLLQPRMIYNCLCKFWAEEVETGRLPRVEIPALPSKNRAPYTLPLGEWPARLRKEYEEYRSWATAPIARNRPARAKQTERTANQRLEVLKSYVGYLFREKGVDLAELGFADLFTEEWVTSFLLWRIDTSRKGVPNETHVNIVAFFTGIVRNYLSVPYEQHKWLHELRAQVERQVRTGVPVDLPTYEELERVADGLREERLAARANSRHVTPSRQRWQALMARNELIVRLLLSRPLRSGNLRGLQIGRTLVTRDGVWWIDIPAEDVKNGQPLAFQWPEDLVELLEAFLKEHRPHLLNGSDSDVLFPTRKGTPMDEKNLLHMVQAACRRHIGKHMTVHSFRDVVATYMLAKAPGALPLVSALLGHRSIGTAVEHYAHLDVREAARRVDQWRMNRESKAEAETPHEDAALRQRLLESRKPTRRGRRGRKKGGRR